VTLPYSGDEFGLPSRSRAKAGVPANLLIIGTIPPARDGGPVDCVAGRGVAAAVHCRKLLVGRDRRARRCHFQDADGPAVRPYRKDSRELNRKLEAYLDRDQQIGHSYLMNLENVVDLRFAWEHKVMPLLQEYFYGDGEKLLAILGKDLVAEEKMILGNSDSGEERIVYHLQETRPGDEFVRALKRIAGVSAE
jgi:hypothetical protein